MLTETAKNSSSVAQLLPGEYQYGFVSDLPTDRLAKGLNEETVAALSKLKDEPAFMLTFRQNAFRHWLTMKEPTWQTCKYPPIDYQGISYYAAPKRSGAVLSSLSEVDAEILRTFDRLGIPLQEQKRLAGVAVDAILDSVSVGTTHRVILEDQGIIFCSIGEAIKRYPELIKKYLGSVVPPTDNFFACLNAAVFTDGSFCYIPKGVKCPLELSTYFRINAAETGQFERTLIVAEERSKVSYLEGCTAPKRSENQLHAAVVELVALDEAEIKYSTVQNWYAGDENGRGGIYNFVTKRGKCLGRKSKISWTQVEVGSAITWKYPSVILSGDGSVGEFYSVALTKNRMQADTGTKMIHIGKNTRSRIVSKGISADRSMNTYRGLVRVSPGASNARNHSQCDSLLLGSSCQANTIPYIEVKNNSATVEHEASTSRINEEQLFYLQSRGYDPEEAVGLLINGFCKDVIRELPMEFAVEAIRLLEMKLEGSVG